MGVVVVAGVLAAAMVVLWREAGSRGVNEAATGRTAAEVVGGGTEFLHPTRESYDRLGPRIKTAIVCGEVFRCEWEFVRKDGTPWIADITATPFTTTPDAASAA